MGSGIKNRQQQTAESCKQHLREAFPDEQVSVEEFIVEFEGRGKHHDITKWNRFTDAGHTQEEMFEKLDLAFKTWVESVT